MHDITVKSVLSPKNGMNLYRGCTHGCIYCDSRSACYGMDHPFEDVAVKVNAIDLLRDALAHKRRPCMIGTGSMCDPYMHAEETVFMTRRALREIEKVGFGVTLLTKSARVMRDIDILERINKESKAVLQMTLTTADENLCRILEPNVSTTAERFDVLMECKKRGIPTVVWLCPILPFINDTDENLSRILDYCLDAGVKGVLCFGFGVTLREGNREYFYQKLDEHFPGMKEKYIAAFGNAYECPSPRTAELSALFHARLDGTGIMTSPDEIFAYLEEYPEKTTQLSLFD